MKPLILPVAIIIALIAFFVIIDRKEFSRHDNVQTVQSESPMTNRKPTVSVPETKPVTKVKPAVETNPAETKPVVETKPVAETKPATDTKPGTDPKLEIESKQKTDAKPAETKPVAETKPAEVNVAETKPAEPKPVAQSKPEENLLPAAVPVVTAEEAEKINAEALVEYETIQKRIDKERARLERGFRLAFSEQFEEYKTVPLTKANEDTLKKRDYDVEEFKKREIPNVWTVDYSTIPAEVSFKKTDDGYSIVSPQGSIRFMGDRLNGMRSSFLFELTVKNTSDKESEIILGVHDSGLIKNGYKTLASEKINSKEEKTIEVELSVFEQLASIAPTISVKGEVVLNDLTIYRKDHDNFTIVEGEIIERSALPDPKDTDYPDCRYTAHFVGNAILDGISCNKEIAISIDGFLKKKVLPTNKLKAGDKIRCAIVPADSVPEDLASIQEADDLSLFTLDSYLVTSYSLISAYTDFSKNFHANALVPFKSEKFEFKSAFNQGFNPPIPDSVKESQKKQIEKDLEEANKMIAYIEENKEDLEQRFQTAWAKEKERFPDGFNTIKKENGKISLYWRNIDNSFWCLPPSYTLIPEEPQELPKDKIDAFVAFKDFLESNGIQLIVSLVPDRYVISSRIINPDFRSVPDIQTASYVKQLSEAGVECPYEVTKILENYNRFQFAYLFPSDYHPGATTQYSVAEEMVGRLSRFNFSQRLDKSLFTFVPKTTYNNAQTGNKRFPSNCDIGDNTADELYLSETVYYDGKVVSKDSDSEILTLGNSFLEAPGSSQRSFPSFLSERMLYPIDQYAVASQGPMTTIIQRIFERPDTFLKNKKVVILQMAATHVNTGTPWNNIAEMDKKKLMLNGKKLVDTLYISGNGDYTNDFVQDKARNNWKNFEGKNDIKCFDDKKFEFFNQTLSNIDTSKSFVCMVQTVRSPLFSVPTLTVNGIDELIPSSHDLALYWQDLYFVLPAGTSQLTIEMQGKKGTIVGFNKVLIYQ